MLRIQDILMWNQSWIRGSMPLTNRSGFGSGSCYFRHRPSTRKQKTNLTKILLFTFWRYITFTTFFKDKKSKRSHKLVGIKIFLLFLLDEKDPDPDPYLWLMDSDPDQGGSKTYDPTDPDPNPDPQHCCKDKTIQLQGEENKKGGPI